MTNSDTKLEAISLLRFLPAGAADIGEEVTREDLREAGLGAWSAPCGRRDDVSPVHGEPAQGGAATGEAELRTMEDYDEVVFADAREPEAHEPVIELRFKQA